MSKRPTDQEIAAEVDALRALEPKVRPYSMFGDDNRAAIAAQIDVLSGRMSSDQVHDAYGEEAFDGDAEFDGVGEFDQYVFDCALQAFDWMAGALAGDNETPAASWLGIVQ